MSDFLSNFSNGKYEEMLKEEQQIATDIDVPPTSNEQNTKNTSRVEPIVMSRTKRSHIGIEEIREQDNTYANERRKKILIIGISVVVMLISSVGGLALFNRVQVPDFIGKSMSDAKTWALKNRIELSISEEFSLAYDKGQVMTQQVPALKNINKGSVMNIQVSKGANQDEVVAIPKLETMKLSAIEEWKSKNRLDNVKIIKEFHETEDSGKFLRKEYKDTKVTDSTYKRRDTLMIYISKGKEVFEKNIEVPDFSQKMKNEVEAWASSSGVQVTYNEVSSDTLAVGMVISQSIAPKEKIAKNEPCSIDVSTGKAIIVPWFGYYSMEEGAQVASSRRLQLISFERYHPTATYGAVISQSIAAGTQLSEQDDLSVEVVYSVGRPYIDLSQGMSEKDIAPYFYEMNSKGAQITYTIHYVYDGGSKGTVVNASRQHEFVEMRCHVDIYISKG